MNDMHAITAAPPGAPRQELDAHAKMRLQRAVKEFESVLVGYMLKSMRAGIPKDEESGLGYGGDMFESLFDMELARHLSRGSQLGLGEMLYKEITGEEMPRHPGKPGVQEPAPAASPAGTATSAAPAAPGTASAAPVLRRPSGGNDDAAPPASPAVPDTVRRRVEAFTPFIQEAADTHGVSAPLLKAVIATESGGVIHARSVKSAKGLMQLIDSTAAAMGVRNVWDPRENINGGAKYLSAMMTRFRGDLERALASYNAGPAAVEKHGGIPPFRETQAYVDKVMNYLRFFEREEERGHDQD